MLFSNENPLSLFPVLVHRYLAPYSHLEKGFTAQKPVAGAAETGSKKAKFILHHDERQKFCSTIIYYQMWVSYCPMQ